MTIASGQWTIGAMTKAKVCLPVQSVSISPTITARASMSNVKKLLDHCQRLFVADDLHLRMAQDQILHRRAVVRLHVVDDQIVQRASVQHVLDIFKEDGR